jgi:hypothetical protein
MQATYTTIYLIEIGGKISPRSTSENSRRDGYLLLKKATEAINKRSNQHQMQ